MNKEKLKEANQNYIAILLLIILWIAAAGFMLFIGFRVMGHL